MNKAVDSSKSRTDPKRVLNQIERASKCEIHSYKKVIPSVFLIGDKGSGRSSFAHQYEDILSTNGVYEVRGIRTFCELVFPKDGSEKDYYRFFKSPNIVASVQNRFYGVFSISFEDWDGNELLISEWFQKLLTFIDNNKDNIYYVFQVTSAFDAKEDLRKVLHRHLNLVEVSLALPTIKAATDYIISYIESGGIVVDDSAQNELQGMLERRLHLEKSSYAGYCTLSQMAESIIFELSSSNMLSYDQVAITSNMLRDIEPRIITPEDISIKSKSIGFLM